jgi:CRP-like cAMP-binding protein
MSVGLGRSWKFVDYDQVANMLRDVVLFSGFRKDQLRKLIGVGTERDYAAGDPIVKQGETGMGFYLMLQGSAEVRKGKRTVSKLNKGDFFGEMSLLAEQPRSADVVATAPTRCLVISPSSFESLIAGSPTIAREMLGEMARRLRSTTDLITE